MGQQATTQAPPQQTEEQQQQATTQAPPQKTEDQQQQSPAPAPTQQSEVDVCYKESRTRKVKVPSECDEGLVKETGLCYQKCEGESDGALRCHKVKYEYTGEVLSEGYWRPAGKVPKNCPDSHPVKQGGLCYEECPTDDGFEYKGVGIVCWQKCSGSMPSAQGAVCCKDAAKCNEFTKTAIESFGGAVAKFLSEDWKGGVEETTKFASNLALSKCGQVKGTEDATDRPVDTDKEQSEKEADQSEKEAEDQELLQRMLKDKDCSCSGICGPCPDCHACHSCLQYGAHCDRILKSEQDGIYV